ncbi:IS110 family transposase [Chondrinema litorale]|uniref:IS110 family transposase n=1 Tax=Chondrinema litorale TaxID=2994555 RepID=UPI0025435C31|nr:IS110 family transposase [Chondrinema litorale]UZR96288.1 IS110 family transposase [Chondrinema litorale]UZR99980.1 IS110 family transposase [Chondrinema litorale]
MKYDWFIGIDISKATFDVACCNEVHPEKYIHRKFNNTLSGFGKMEIWLKQKGVNFSRTFIGMEHTGIYVLHLCTYLGQKGIAYSLENPLEIKRSIGIQRGKNDKVDSWRIVDFLFSRRHKLTSKPLPSKTILEIKNLLAYRERAIKTKVSLEINIQDMKDTNDLIDNSLLISMSEQQLNIIKIQLKELNKKLREIVARDEDMKKNYKLVVSVPGIGLITGLFFLVYTQNFTVFTNGRKFASYSGVAPFEHSSGVSIRGKTRVSPLANKKMKALLSNCACTAIQHDSEMKQYYHRKKKQGKERCVALNAVKAKLINRVFSVVKRKSEYLPFNEYRHVA